MTQYIKDHIKTIKSEGKLLSHKHSDISVGAKHFRCSTYILKEKLLVKGEWNNVNWRKKKALLIFLDKEKGIIKGNLSSFFYANLKALE